jgi:acyl carrier protein
MKVTVGEIAGLVSVQLGAGEVRGEHHLIQDLGAESVDLVNILSALVDRYGVDVVETDLADIQTVADLARLVQSRLAPDEQ